MNNQTWWGEKFIEALISFIQESRLRRGRSYCSPSRISQYTQNKNIVTATIMGNKNPYFSVYKTPYYHTRIKFTRLSSEHTVGFEDDPLLLAKLVTRELPQKVASILPQGVRDIETSCSCPDWENPCKHIAGLYFKIAEEIDFNPLLLFSLRGISEEKLSEKIKKYITLPKEKQNELTLQPKPKPNTMNIKSFWGSPRQTKNQAMTSAIPLVLVKKAGLNPPFWHKKTPFSDSMHNIYKNMRRSWNSRR